MSLHKPCYGNMFPNVLPPVDTGHQSGKVFLFQFENLGLTHGQSSVSVDSQKWDDRLRCPKFDHCYKLSMGLLAL